MVLLMINEQGNRLIVTAIVSESIFMIIMIKKEATDVWEIKRS